MPALHDLMKAWMRLMSGGDQSQWDAAFSMPHYSTYSMPALSLHSAAHVSGAAGRPVVCEVLLRAPAARGVVPLGQQPSCAVLCCADYSFSCCPALPPPAAACSTYSLPAVCAVEQGSGVPPV